MKCIRQICLILPSSSKQEREYVHQSDKLQNKPPTDFGLNIKPDNLCSLSRVICCEEKFYYRKTIPFHEIESVEVTRRKTKN